MRTRLLSALIAIALLAAAGCHVEPAPTQPAFTPSASVATATPSLPPGSQIRPTSAAASSALIDPFALISQDRLLAFTRDLTAIQPYSGWRNSATQGEQEALDYVAKRLGEWEHLRSLGLELERQSFRVFMATELWEARLHLKVNGREIEAPASGLRGDRDNIAQALRFDSDGALNDSERNPVVVDNPVVLIRSADEVHALSSTDVEGKIILLDYAVIDRVVLGLSPAHTRLSVEGAELPAADHFAGGLAKAVAIASEVLARRPAGLVLVTQFSNKQGASHGAFVGDVSALNPVDDQPAPPTLYVRLEDLAPAGIETWDDLARVESARMVWDADVFFPASSGNLIARIPGVDSSRAVILGAHIDSPNNPGALDDGSGSAILLEVARVIDAARIQPATDVYLVWFGSEEIGLYGSYHFVATHQALLDRTLAMLQIDALSRPLDGIHASLELETWSYGRLGDDRLTWPDYLSQVASQHGVQTNPVNKYGIASDNSGFVGFDVPNANLTYLNTPEMLEAGGVHYAAHFHDPYDTVELAVEVAEVYEQMATVVLAAALQAADAPELRVTPAPDRRALFVASHTEVAHVAPTAFTDFGMALAMQGFDVDMIPYGQPVTSADLKGVDLVIALPVLDYPSPDGDLTLYDEAWSEAEIAALEKYVADGGLLVLTNSALRLKYNNRVQDHNEDWRDANVLAERFGILYVAGTLDERQVPVEGNSPLAEGVSSLTLAIDNTVPFTMIGGQALAQSDGEWVVALKDYGHGGQVLALADVGILGTNGGVPANLPFWQNLARYARAR